MDAPAQTPEGEEVLTYAVDNQTASLRERLTAAHQRVVLQCENMAEQHRKALNALEQMSDEDLERAALVANVYH